MNTAELDGAIIRLLGEQGRVSEESLHAVVMRSCETDIERQMVEDEGVYAALEEPEPIRTLLDLEWEAWGTPNSSSDSMLLIALGDHDYLCLPPDVLEETHRLLILGAVDHNAGIDAVSALVRDRLASLFDYNVWSARLPTKTVNNRPELVTRQAVKEAYRSAARSDEVWAALLDDLAAMTDDELVGAARGASAGDATSSDVSEEATQSLVFDRWFERTYTELGKRSGSSLS